MNMSKETCGLPDVYDGSCKDDKKCVQMHDMKLRQNFLNGQSKMSDKKQP